eukprot:scaffold7060_cov280-Pinguiococcus_pyrenoidosus.AAC.9
MGARRYARCPIPKRLAWRQSTNFLVEPCLADGAVQKHQSLRFSVPEIARQPLALLPLVHPPRKLLGGVHGVSKPGRAQPSRLAPAAQQLVDASQVDRKEPEVRMRQPIAPSSTAQAAQELFAAALGLWSPGMAAQVLYRPGHGPPLAPTPADPRKEAQR